MHLKSLSDRQDGRPPPSWDGAIIPWNLSPSRFQSENVTFFRDYYVITWGFPAKIGKPPQNRDFWPISYRNVHSVNQSQCNNTCFVQKLPIKASSHPFPHHPPDPIIAPPLLPHPLAPFCNSFPLTILPPLPKANGQLKIVNYFTCMRHFFCRW